MPTESGYLVQVIAIAIAVGILAQVVAGWARLPSIVFLLVFGVLAGPDGLGLIDTEILGSGLQAIVTIAVALILFEGGLQLHYLDLAAVGRTVRNLVTIGAAVTVAGATVTAHYVAGLDWHLALLFGSIVCVTGPTVINPLLDRVRVFRRTDTILRGEGILIDPLGAILAAVALELIVTARLSVWEAPLEILRIMAIGTVIGLVSGWALGRVLRFKGLLSDELKNVAVLAWVMALFAVSQALAGESGFVAVVIAGMTVRRESIPQQHRLRRFKGELSVLLISVLFILLSAHLPLATLRTIGWPGVWTVLLLMVVVRPLDVLVATWGTDVSWRERLFMMWISPRGVVAISIASFVAIRIETGSPALIEAGLTAEDGAALLALVFMTVAITVLVQGLTAGPLAKRLGILAHLGNYVVVVGANKLGRIVGRILKEHGWDVLLIDANHRKSGYARQMGLATVTGNALDRHILGEVGLDGANAVLSVTENQEINFLVAQQAKDEGEVEDVYPTLIHEKEGAHLELVEEIGGEVAFGRPIDIERWIEDLRNERIETTTIELGEEAPSAPLSEIEIPASVLPVLRIRDERSQICHGGTKIGPGDRVIVLFEKGAADLLKRGGWPVSRVEKARPA